VVRRVMNINMAKWRGNGRLQKKWMDRVRQDMREMDEVTTDRGEWKKTCANPKRIGTRAGRRNNYK
jgi:hypothetical protein